jgi:hypothetical protein
VANGVAIVEAVELNKNEVLVAPAAVEQNCIYVTGQADVMLKRLRVFA